MVFCGWRKYNWVDKIYFLPSYEKNWHNACLPFSKVSLSAIKSGTFNLETIFLHIVPLGTLLVPPSPLFSYFGFSLSKIRPLTR